jgi:hypothetical protein
MVTSMKRATSEIRAMIKSDEWKTKNARKVTSYVTEMYGIRSVYAVPVLFF